jgi:hypothetical protein
MSWVDKFSVDEFTGRRIFVASLELILSWSDAVAQHGATGTLCFVRTPLKFNHFLGGHPTNELDRGQFAAYTQGYAVVLSGKEIPCLFTELHCLHFMS